MQKGQKDRKQNRKNAESRNMQKDQNRPLTGPVTVRSVAVHGPHGFGDPVSGIRAAACMPCMVSLDMLPSSCHAVKLPCMP